jgi:hypothetical protein
MIKGESKRTWTECVEHVSHLTTASASDRDSRATPTATVPRMTMNGTVRTWRLRVAHLLALGVLYPYPEPLGQGADRGIFSICYEISIPHVCALTSPYFHQ